MRVASGAMAIGLVAGLLGCGIEAPETPSFQTQIIVPVSKQHISVAELVEGLEGIVIDSTSVRIDVSGDLDSVRVDDQLSASVAGVSFDAVVGDFDLPANLGGGVSFTFADLTPPGTPTGNVIVPPFTFSVPPRDVQGLDEFSQITFASGSIVIEITNGLPVPIGGLCGNPGLAVAIRGSGATQDPTVSWLSEVAPGETAFDSYDLTGETIGNSFQIEMWGCSPGSGGQFVNVQPTDSVSVVVRLENATASSAVTEVPAQVFTDTGSSTWRDDLPLTGAALLSGSAPVRFDNQTPLDMTVEMLFPGFTQGSDTLRVSVAVPAMSQDSTAVDFAGVTFSSPIPTTSADYRVRASTPGSGGGQVTLSATDGIRVDVGQIDFEFDWVEGVPDAISRDLGPSQSEVEWPDETGGVVPAAASVTLSIANEFEAAFSGNVVVVGTNGVDVDSLVQPVAIVPGMPGAPVVTDIVIDETNSNILDLLALYPTSLEVRGDLTVGDGATSVRLERDAALIASYAISSPFAFTVEADEIELDPYTIELDDDIRELITEQVTRVRITARLENGFPFGAIATPMFATDSLTVFTAPELVLDPLDAPAAVVDPVSGKTIDATTSENMIELAEDELLTFDAPMVFLGLRVETLPSGGVVVVSPEDEVVVQSYLTVDLTVDDGLFDDEEGGDGSGN